MSGLGGGDLSKSSSFLSKGCPQVVKDEMKAILNVHNESLSEKVLGDAY